MSGAYGVELGLAPTWRMYSWHSAWCCQSHRLLLKSPPPPVPSSKSYIPVLWKEKREKHSWNMRLSHTVHPYVRMWVKGKNSSTLTEKCMIQYRHQETLLQAEDERIPNWCISFTFINLLLDLSNIIAERPVLLPGWMLSLIMLTCSSLSGRVCSCQNPITWPNSWTTMPNLSQFFPMDMACGPPPRRPT